MVAERYCLLPRPVISVPTQEPLSPAEQNVLSYVCAGYSNHPSPRLWMTGKEIARFLGKAEPTVKCQVSACLRKFGLSSRMRLWRPCGRGAICIFLLLLIFLILSVPILFERKSRIKRKRTILTLSCALHLNATFPSRCLLRSAPPFRTHGP